MTIRFCGPDEIRTHNSLNANQVLYQLELRAHNKRDQHLLQRYFNVVVYQRANPHSSALRLSGRLITCFNLLLTILYWSRWHDSNVRPSGPKPDILTNWTTSRKNNSKKNTKILMQRESNPQCLTASVFQTNVYTNFTMQIFVWLLNYLRLL